MDKVPTLTIREPPRPPWRVGTTAWIAGTAVGLIGLITLYGLAVLRPNFFIASPLLGDATTQLVSLYGQFPLPNDPFSFIPCTDSLLLPPLNDSNPKRTWAGLFDPNHEHWSWGNSTPDDASDGPYAGRGIYLCGYLDLPLDYLDDSDTRIVRLAVTKFQVSGLVRIDSPGGRSSTATGGKSERTIVIQPSGPGASGTLYVWEAAEAVTKRFSDGQFDILGWDPRGVNASLPVAACLPNDVYRDRWWVSLPKLPMSVDWYFGWTENSSARRRPSAAKSALENLPPGGHKTSLHGTIDSVHDGIWFRGGSAVGRRSAVDQIGNALRGKSMEHKDCI